MRSTLRALGLAAALFTGSFAIAQNVVTITGTVSPCMGVIYPVHIVTNSVPPIDTTVYTGANCQYSFTFFPVETQGTFVVETSCDGGATWSSATGSWNPFFPQVVVDLSCTGGPCLLDAFGSLFCATPWQVVFSGGAGNGTPPYSYNWSFWNGSTSMQPIETVTLLAPGTFTACLLVTDANGCVDDTCFTFVMDADGNMTTGNTFPCSPCVQLVQSTNGPAGPPIPWALEAMNCSSGGVQPVQYSYAWSTGESTQSITAAMEGEYFVCIYMLDANGCQATTCDSVYVDANGNVGIEPQPCQAGFWVFQAYEVDSLNPNGGAVPIPFELWVWNLSTGTSPFNFEWDFGDGTSSFDPYPTHVYGASGPYNLCLTIDDASGCSSIYCDSVSIDGDGFYEGMAPESEVRNGFTIRVLNQLPTSVEEQAYNEPRLWPNPVTDALSLSFRSTVSGTVTVSIIDPDGRSVRQERLAFNRGANSISLNASDLAAGIYLLRIGDDANTMNIRFIKH